MGHVRHIICRCAALHDLSIPLGDYYGLSYVLHFKLPFFTRRHYFSDENDGGYAARIPTVH